MFGSQQPEAQVMKANDFLGATAPSNRLGSARVTSAELPADLQGISILIPTFVDLIAELVTQILSLTQTQAATNSNKTTNTTTSTPSNSTTTKAISKSGDVATNSNAQQVLKLVNDFRAENGLPPVKLDDRMNQAAQKHSDFMAETAQISHTGRNGSKAHERMTAEGVSWRTAAENVAAGQQTPEQVVQDWINSPGHRANLLNADATIMGLGENSNYWTLDLAG